MRRVYKYPIPEQNYFSLDLPRGAKILTVQVGGGKPQLWALVNEHTCTTKRNFRLAETGELIQENTEELNYIDTFQQNGGNYVCHLFEIK